jgi:hypothetical protein
MSERESTAANIARHADPSKGRNHFIDRPLDGSGAVEITDGDEGIETT